MDAAARALVRKLGLKPHPEGGFFREIHRAAESVATCKGRRSALTMIYFLLARGGADAGLATGPRPPVRLKAFKRVAANSEAAQPAAAEQPFYSGRHRPWRRRPIPG